MGNPSVHLCVAIPAYREEENLRILLPRIREVLDRLPGPSEILIVDTQSSLDSTRAVCEENGARWIQRGPGNCFGDAVRTAIAESQGDWTLFMDADGSHAPEFIEKLLQARDAQKSDITVASRYIDGGDTENPRVLIWMSRALNLTYRLILGLRIKDVSNSFKLYRTSLLKPLQLKCENFDIIEEILFKIVRRDPRVRMVEIPFLFRKRMFGESKRNLFAFILTYLFTIVKLRLSGDDGG